MQRCLGTTVDLPNQYFLGKSRATYAFLDIFEKFQSVRNYFMELRTKSLTFENPWTVV